MQRTCLSFKRTRRSLLVLFAIAVVQHCYAGQKGTEPVPKERVEEIKRIYQFDKWAGKVKIPNRKVETLNIDPNFFEAISRKTKVFTPQAKRTRELNLEMIDRASGLNVDIEIVVTNSPERAHKNIVNFLSLVVSPPPAFKRVDPNDPNDPLNIGDVCFVPVRPWIPEKIKKPVIRDLLFCRDNVFVMLWNSGDETKESYPDLGRIARLIDNKLKEISKPTQ